MGNDEVNLMDIREVLNGLGVPFSLEAGTLLFAYRDGRLDPSDTDVAVMHDGMEKIVGAQSAFEKLGFELHKLFRHPSGLASEISFKRDGKKVDIFGKEFRGDKAWSLSFNDAAPPERYYIPHVYPAKHFKSYDKLDLLGVEWNIPHDTEEYLKAVYGDWRTPDPLWVWWRDPKCIDYSWEIK